MARKRSLLDKMQQNKCGWKVRDVKRLLSVPGVNFRDQGDHMVFWVEGEWQQLALPRSNPVLPVYVRQAIAVLRLAAPEAFDP